MANLATVIERFQAGGYRFIRSGDIGGSLAADDRCVLLTFDDGYANNLRALPILRHYGVPATFFIATGNVSAGEAYWWDVLYRERLRRNASLAEIVTERHSLMLASRSGYAGCSVRTHCCP